MECTPRASFLGNFKQSGEKLGFQRTQLKGFFSFFLNCFPSRLCEPSERFMSRGKPNTIVLGPLIFSSMCFVKFEVLRYFSRIFSSMLDVYHEFDSLCELCELVRLTLYLYGYPWRFACFYVI